jgi:hypothetical protein
MFGLSLATSNKFCLLCPPPSASHASLCLQCIYPPPMHPSTSNRNLHPVNSFRTWAYYLRSTSMENVNWSVLCTIATFPLSHIIVHLWMASESSIKVVYFVTAKTLNWIELQSLPVSLQVSTHSSLSLLICLRHHTHMYTKAGQRFPMHIGQVTEMLMTFCT